MIEVRILASSSLAETLSNALEALGAAAVTWLDAGNQPIYEPKPGEIMEWDNVALTAYFIDSFNIKKIKTYLDKQAPVRYQIHEVEVTSWEAASTEQPMLFGHRLWICPTGATVADPQAITVEFNAGLAFGTGRHETTALCLEWLDANIHGGEVVMDYGCGSGILAIAALKLGASKAVAVDYDAQAILAVRTNAVLNHFDARHLIACLPEDLNHEPVPVLLANIIAPTLIDLAPQLAALVLPGGRVVLSGVMAPQEEAVVAAYAPWFAMRPARSKDGWVLLEGVKR